MQDIDKIDWSKVLLGQRVTERQSVLKRVFALICRMSGTLIRKSVPTVCVGNDEVLFVKSMRRKDYESQWSLILECYEGDKTVVDLSWRRGLSLDPIRRWLRVGTAYRSTSCIEGLLDRLLATMLCLYYLDALKAFSEVHPRAVVFFSEMRPAENVLVQWFNAKAVPTVTLQHGLYIDYGGKPTINRLNYEASCAQTFLAWGDETAQLIKRYNPAVECVICGAPQITEPEPETKPPCIYVVFDADINAKQNRQLLSVGKQLGQTMSLEVVVCLHPRNRKDLYELSGVSFLLEGDNYRRSGYVLGHTTTQIIKLARFGKQVYKLRSAEPCNRMIPDAVQFDTYEDLIGMLADMQYPHGWASEHIALIDSAALECYRRFFSKL